MLFDYDLIIPPLTAKTAPASIEARLIKGTLKRVEIFFPPGCAALANVIIRDQLNQIAPANPSGSFNADEATIRFDMNYILEASGHPLICEGWSPACTYQHTIIFRFEVTPDGESDNSALADYLASFLLPMVEE